MAKVLLANLHECPENLHFELALIRALRGRRGISLDVVHDFDYEYRFLGPSLPPGGRRTAYGGLPELKGRAAGHYDLLVILDFPKRARCAAGFLWLAREADAARKVFVANHLTPLPGRNAALDLAVRFRLLAGFEAGYVLEFDGRGPLEAAGLAGARLLPRGYAVDCEYYSPVKGPAGGYIFSAGTTGRDFRALAAGAKAAGFGLRILGGARPPGLPPGTRFLPLSQNLHRLKAEAAGAAAVVVPVKDGHYNEAAGNSIAFIGMALGRPVLARRTPYMERFIKDGVNGFLYDELSAESLAAGLRRIKALKAAQLARLSAAARRTALEKSCLDRFCRQFTRKFL